MYFTLQRVQRICTDLNKLICHSRTALQNVAYKPGRFMNPAQAQADAQQWQNFGPTDRWGSYDGHGWFHAEAVIPSEYAGKKILLDVSVDSEHWFADSRQFILFVNGEMRQGLDINHRQSVLCHNALPRDTFQIDLHAYAGLVDKPTGLYLQLMVQDEAIRKLYYDIDVPRQVAAELPEHDKTRLDVLTVLNEAVNRLDMRKPYSGQFYASVADAQEFVERELYQNLCGHEAMSALCVGHTHIDVAWLWTLAQTREKVARSFSTVLELMDAYPEYVFMSSQPQLYQFLKQDYPEVYDRVRARISEGRWEAEGAMWVEADCNLVSGESFIRQILHGTAFFKDEFGAANRVLWLPDVFGYSAALPQILKKSGIDYFMTTKINWNQYNHIPADTFLWQGLDGSEVLTHFITTKSEGRDTKPYFSTYNGVLAPGPVMGGWNRYQDKQIHDEILVAYGYGDGGGGTNEDMIERGLRMARGIPGCPSVRMGTVLEFFLRAEERVGNSHWLKKWVGELYFEYHRGTYTSMARNKRYNRKAELLYHDVETLACCAQALAGESYPVDRLQAGWETILLNQFHDILPGSSIQAVYEDSQEQYEQVLGSGRCMADQALDAINRRISLEKPSVVVHNTTGFARSEIAQFEWPERQPLPMLLDTRTGQSLATQRNGGNVLFVACDVPAKGYRAFPVAGHAPAPSSELHVSATRLENRFFLVELDSQGHFTSVYDKMNKREILAAGKQGNVLRAFEDKPMAHQNWDIDIYYQQKSWVLDEITAIEVVESGPVRGALRITRPFLDSVVAQTIYIYESIPRIDFDTDIDWKADEVLLKAEFPVDIHADTATYDIQFGNVTRPTHWNTSWDWARFEVCGHKWADLSEDGYGVSLLNDCKYGYDIHSGVMRLTLIKSGMAPNPHADRERHRFVYSLYPHKGAWRQGGTMEMAYSLNIPLYASAMEPQAGSLPAEFSLIGHNTGHVMLETVKRAQDGDGFIARLFEYCNSRGAMRVDCGMAIASVRACNLMEQETGEAVQADASGFSFNILPYEIKTFRIRPV